MGRYDAAGYATALDEGVLLPRRRNLNFVGAGVTVTDEPATDTTTVTIAGGGGGAAARDITLKATASTISNAPAGITDIGTGFRTKADLTTMTSARFTVAVTTAGSAGTEMRIQYSTDQVTWLYLDAVDGPKAAIDSTGVKAAVAVALTAGAKADVFLRAILIGGDGIADPAFGTVNIQCTAA